MPVFSMLLFLRVKKFILLQVSCEYKAVLMSGAILTVEDGRYRLRRLPIQPIETSLED